MLKAIKNTLALIALTLIPTTSAFAMDVVLAPNTKNEGDGKAYIVKFDGSSTMGVMYVEKVIKCHEAFSDDNKEKLLGLLDVPDIKTMKDNLETMRKEHITGTLTTDDKALYEDFVSGALKACMSF